MKTFTYYAVIVLLILTNAITDAPNAIATLVGTKATDFKKASTISGIFNFLGIIVMSFINISIASCISLIIRFENKQDGMIIVFASMVSVIVFANLMLKYGIPTSETHGLIAGLTGAGIAISGLNSVNVEEWRKVVIGLIVSILLGYIVSIIVVWLFGKVFSKMRHDKLTFWQKLSSAGMAFMHGAQDGQKFIGILIIYNSILANLEIQDIYINPKEYIGIILAVAIIMGLGSKIGGRKIVETVGNEMVQLNNSQGLMTDIASILVLFFSSLNGIPVSTSHVKTITIAGVGNASNNKVDKKIIIDIFKAWIVTFPVCGIISFLIAKFLIWSNISLL